MNVSFNQKINQFVKQMPSFSKKDLTIFYVYRKLAPFFQRDLNFFLVDKMLQFQMYSNGFLMNGKEVVCQTICKYYGRVFKRLHIDFKIITTNTKAVPHYAMLVHGDTGWFFIDPLKDLLVNQMGFKPHFFGILPPYGSVPVQYPYLEIFDDNYLFQLAQETNTLQLGHFMDFYMNCLHHDFFNSSFINHAFDDVLSSVLDKLSFISQYLINLNPIPGLFERQQYYNYLKSILFSRVESKQVECRLSKEGLLDLIVYRDLDRCQEFAVFRENFLLEKGYSLERIR